MNKFLFNDLKVNKNYFFYTKITKKMMDQFKNISGDTNPLHTNDKFAKEHGFKKKIVYGLLSSSFYSKLIGIYIPGMYSVITKIDISFHNPTYINDVLKVSGFISKKDERFKIAHINASIINDSNLLLSTSKVQVNVKK